MTETKLKILFVLLFVCSFLSIVLQTNFFPAIRFPQFPNKQNGKQISYSSVKLFSYRDNKEVNLMNVIKPYDKQYYLFSLRALSDEKTADNMLQFMNHLYKLKNNSSDSLYFKCEKNTIQLQ